MKKLFSTLTILFIFFTCSATIMQFIKRQDFYSPNGLFVLDANPTGKYFIYKKNDREKPLWSFEKEHWSDPLVSNNGKTLAIIGNQHLYINELNTNGVEIWSEKGLIKEIKVEKLCPTPPKTELLILYAPVDDKLHSWYYEVRSNGETFTIKTTNMDKYEISLSDGKILSKTKVRSLKREEEATLGILNIIGLTSIPFLVYLVLFLTYRIFKKDRKRRKRKLKH